MIAPSPQHHLALTAYQEAFPEAFFLCGKASGQMQPLTKKRRDLRFDAVIATGCGKGGAVLGAAVPDNEGADNVASARRGQPIHDVRIMVGILDPRWPFKWD